MPVTTIDPAAALVVIDIQKGIVGNPFAHPVDGVVNNVVHLVEAFRARNRPIAFVHVAFSVRPAGRTQAPAPSAARPDDFSEFLEVLSVNPETDITILKRQWGAFYGTDLDLQLRRRGITNIVLCGIATGRGVESTARDAWERNYNLTFASDAMTDASIEAHDRAIEFIFPRLGEIGTTNEIIAKL